MIIELQGTLETKEDVSLEGKAIGDLHFDAKVGAYSDRSFRLRVVSLMHQSIDLVTVFDAILTSRQTREKLQCLYENLIKP